MSFTRRGLIRGAALWVPMAPAIVKAQVLRPRSRSRGGFAFPAPLLAAVTSWNPLDAGPTIVLSNANQTASSNSTVYNTVRATKSQSAGNLYFEYFINLATTETIVGIVDAAASLNSYPGANADGEGYDNGGVIFGQSSGVSTYTTGDIIGVAVNLTARNIQFYLNNNSVLAAYALKFSGPVFPAVTPLNTTAKITLRATAVSQTYAPPTGFTAWG